MVNQSFDFKQFRQLQKRGDIFLFDCDRDVIKTKFIEIENLLQNNIAKFEFSAIKK